MPLTEEIIYTQYLIVIPICLEKYRTLEIHQQKSQLDKSLGQQTLFLSGCNSPLVYTHAFKNIRTAMTRSVNGCSDVAALGHNAHYEELTDSCYVF